MTDRKLSKSDTISFEGLVSKKWLSWENIQRALETFPFKGPDKEARPPALMASRMKSAKDRKIVGNFSEISTLVQLFTSIFYEYVLPRRNPHRQLMLRFRNYAKYCSMVEVSEKQLQE